MHNSDLIPDRTDDPIHINNLLTEKQRDTYFLKANQYMKRFNAPPEVELCCEYNSYGRFVMFDKETPFSILEPNFVGNEIYILPKSLNRNMPVCHRSGCTSTAVFSRKIYNKTYLMCKKHKHMFLRTNSVETETCARFLPPDIEIYSDLNGNYAYIGTRDQFGNTKDHIIVDEEDIDWTMVNKPRIRDRFVIVSYNDAEQNLKTSLLNRVFYGKNRINNGIYDNKGIPISLAIDHIGQQTRNERRYNLRCITPYENHENKESMDKKKKEGVPAVLGINKLKNGRYKVSAYKCCGNCSYKAVRTMEFDDFEKGYQWKRDFELQLLANQGLDKFIDSGIRMYKPEPKPVHEAVRFAS